MRERVEKLPENNIDIEPLTTGFCKVTLYKNPITETDAEGKETITAEKQSFTLPKADKDSIAAHFAYYWERAEAEEVAKSADLKINQLRRLLDSTDYKLLKHADGVLSDAEYAPWKALRAHWREVINRLEAARTLAELDAVRWAETAEGLLSLG